MEQKIRDSKKKPIKKSWLTAACLLLTAGFLCGAVGSPGTQADPLVTQSWVKQYVLDATKETEQRIDRLALALGGSRTIEMWVNKKQVRVNGTAAAIDVPPILQNNRTMLPFRYIGQQLGAKVDWDNQAKKATYTKGNTKLVLTIGKKEVTINGKTEALDTPAVLQQGRVLVPVRVVSQQLGAKVDWLSPEKKIIITYKEK